MKSRSTIFILLASIFPYAHFSAFLILNYLTHGRVFKGETTAGFVYLAGLYIVTPALIAIATIIILYDLTTRKLAISRKILSIFFVCALTLFFLKLFSGP